MDMSFGGCCFGTDSSFGILGGIAYEMVTCGVIGAFLGSLAVIRHWTARPADGGLGALGTVLDLGDAR